MTSENSGLRTPLPPSQPRSPARALLNAAGGAAQQPGSKPLIHSFLATATNVAAPREPAGARPRRGSQVGNSGSVGDAPLAPAKTVTCNTLFMLSPGVRERVRMNSHGAMLSETESLHLKHVEEYNFLVVALGSALQQTLTSHERLYAEAMESARTRNGIPPIAQSCTEMTAFNTPSAASLTVQDYLKRIVKYTYASPSALMVACLYMDRLLCRIPSLLFHSFNCLKLILSSVRIASKVLDTRSLNNKDFAVVGGISNDELNKLEVLFAERLEFDLYVSPEEFYDYSHDLIALALGVDTLSPSSPSFGTPVKTDQLGRRGSVASMRRGRSSSLMSVNGAPLLGSAMHPSNVPSESSMTMTRSFYAFSDAEADTDAGTGEEEGEASSVASSGRRAGKRTSLSSSNGRSASRVLGLTNSNNSKTVLPAMKGAANR